jgi:hypothetical protein
MELGNMIHGNSRGEYPIKRGKGFEAELERLFNAYAPKRDNSWREYGVAFKNEVFEVFPYYWGECDCGYDERFEASFQEWSKENQHLLDCYQVELRTRLAEYDRQIGYMPPLSFMDVFNIESEPLKLEGHTVGEVMMMTPKKQDRTLYELHGQFEDQLMDELCAKFKLDRKHGAAVHCTCGYTGKYQEWVAQDDHSSECSLIKPNFLHNPTGFSIQWYKYPLRDAYMSEKITLVQFRKIIDECIQSVNVGCTASDMVS